MRIIALLFIYYGCVFYAFINPTFGLLFFIHITIFRPESLAWGNPEFGHLHFITSLSVLIGYFAQRYFTQKKIINNILDNDYQKVNIRLFFFFTLWLVIVSLLAEYSVQLSLNKAVEVLKIFVLCFLFAKLVTSEWQFQAYIWVVSISFGLLGFWGILQGLMGNSRLDSLWPGGSNYIAAQLALICPLTFTKIFDPTLSFKKKLLFIFCCISIILCCIFTSSRGGFLGMAIGIFICIIFLKQRIQAFIFVLIATMLFAPLIPVQFFDRVDSIFVKNEKKDDSALSRFVTWAIALRIWRDHPIAGVGLENFSPVKENYVGEVYNIVPSQEIFTLIFNRQRYPHGMYHGMMAETGSIGILIFFTLFLRNILCRFPDAFIKNQTYFPLYQQVQGVRAGLIGFAVAAYFGDFQYVEIFYLQLFFVGAVRGYAGSFIRSLR